MKWMLAAWLVAMTGCATDDGAKPGDDSDDQALAVHSLECIPLMSVSGAGPYSVQCAANYSVTSDGVQLAFTGTDANGQTWSSSMAAAPMATGPDVHGTTVFALTGASAPATGSMTVHVQLVDHALDVTSNELVSHVLVQL